MPAMNVEINSSVGNLGDKSAPQALFWTVERYISTVKEAGYTGLEWFPLRTPVVGLQMRLGLLSQQAKDGIRSLHQSYRSEKSFREAWNHPNRPLAALSYFLLPERVSSLNDLEHIQKVLGRKLPVVLYPSQEGEESGAQRHFADKLFQPTPGVMRQWGAKSIQELIEQTYQRGYTGLCLDLFHFRKPDEIDLNPWQETLPQLLPHTKEIHISAGRGDMMQDYVDTNAELRDLLNGTQHTDLPRILRAIKDLGWSGRMVTEIPATSLKLILGTSSRFLDTNSFIEGHRSIVGNTKVILS